MAVQSRGTLLRDEQADSATATLLTADDTIGDLLKHPAFADFSRLLLPSDDRTYDGRMRLQSIGSLLPYHSHVDPAEVVEGLNRIIEEVHNGRLSSTTSTPTKRGSSSRRSGTPASSSFAAGRALHLPSSLRAEAFPTSAPSMKAFPMRSRSAVADTTRSSEIPRGIGGDLATRDLAAAISYIFRNAAALGVATERYSFGGVRQEHEWLPRLARTASPALEADNLPNRQPVVLAYTGHSDHSADEPPTFVVVGERDANCSSVRHGTTARGARRAGAEVEFHRYHDVGHGFGPGIGTTAEGWLDLAIEFWEKVMHAHAERGAGEGVGFLT
jgi:hypothetical protein